MSLGSSKGNFSTTIVFPDLGEVEIARIGCDGDIDRMKLELKLVDLNPCCQAIGLGGMDLYLFAGNQKYTFREAKQLTRLVKNKPIVDGSILKNTLEKIAIETLAKTIDFSQKKVLMVSSVDRYGMAKALSMHARQIIFGDVIYGLGLPIPVKNLQKMEKIAKSVLPIATKCPIKWFYPTGKSQDKIPASKCKYASWADVIAGDFHYIKANLPANLSNKIVITNTVREFHIKELKKRKLKTLITTTPVINGQSFGTNLLEAAIIAACGKKLNEENMLNILPQLNLKPGIFQLN